MFHMPMSSPMMNRMLGFLPSFGASSFCPARINWVPGGRPSGQQPASAAAGLAATDESGGAAVAVRFSERCPAAAAYPSRAPAATRAAVDRFLRLNMVRLLEGPVAGSDGRKSIRTPGFHLGAIGFAITL